MSEKPICKIINDSLSYRLEVDGKNINFDGGSNVDYFKELYTKLGYTVLVDNDFWKRKEATYATVK
jgi:uncharacterized protein YmfQ (DUF2313 family)